ncbi:MAG: AI-2E family transporter [Ignavibacteria bacterium]|jgi:predicted PurR-regulated permease PerM|nr:AI-2E family transporter [Ignavibacteria bacterium]MCU7512002.1 AI-2E family transporter [Ignavibacteria bacterium]MCU7524747.1 AI-2E family transporter [Ignavibacteria bacterium]
MHTEKSRFSATSAFFVNVIGIVVIFIVLKSLAEIFIPFIIAYFLFFVFSPLNALLESRKVPISAVAILDILIIIIVLGSFSSVIVNSFSALGEALPGYEAKLNQIVSSTANSFGIKDRQFQNFKITNLLQRIDYGPLAGNVFSSTFSFLGSFLFVLFFFIFIMSGHKNIYGAIKRRYLMSHMPEDLKTPEVEAEARSKSISPDSLQVSEKYRARREREQTLQSTFQEITDQIQKYVIAKFVISLLVGIATAIVLLLFGVDFVVVWAVITFLFNFIPNIGSLIATVLPALMTLVQFGSIGYALIVAGILVVLHNVFGNVVEPRIFGHRLGLNPLVILLSLLLWAYIWGIVGAILSVPLTAIIKIIISRLDSPNANFFNDLMGV